MSNKYRFETLQLHAGQEPDPTTNSREYIHSNNESNN
jgi:O-acetylhomoserine/O-acetylserine sulfhydrylase-like pyridoxal-dependent enzyme